MEGRVDGECKVPRSGATRDDLTTNDEILRHFIETYKGFPELWNSSHRAYMNKARRNLALSKLLKIYSKMKAGANYSDVKRKINTLRSNYRKEIRKIVSSRESGSGTGEVYQPRSWVFHALKFLNDSELVEYQCDDEGQNLTEQSPSPQPPESTRSSIISPPPPAKTQRLVGPPEEENELLSLACKYLKTHKEPHVPIITKVWGEKLMTLDTQQRLFAEKAINDVLFEASLGNLNRYSVKINEVPNQPSSFNSHRPTAADLCSQTVPSTAGGTQEQNDDKSKE